MKRFFLAVVLCASLLGVLSSFLFPSAAASENPLLTLLNLPAPPPPNPQVSFPVDTYAENFFSKNDPPPDDAPIEDLMEYWSFQSQNVNELQYKPSPTEKVLERLLGEVEKDPSKLGEIVNIIPRTPRTVDLVKEIYDRSATGNEAERAQLGRLKRWLKVNTPHFSSELAREASRVSDQDDYVTNHRSLIALARVDWDRAAPIVNRLYNNLGQKASRTAAIWALYVHAMESGSPSDTERYRDELKEIVSDKSLGAGVRDLALDALSMEKEWSGRDEWYLSMMEDETLTDLGRFTGLTTLIATSPDGKYIDRMIGLLDSDNIAVRSAAAQNLLDRIDANRANVVKALLRWLENPKWLKQTGRSGRQKLVQALAQVKIPESVPGLIAALDEKERRAVSSHDQMANTMASAAAQAARAAQSADPAMRAAIANTAMRAAIASAARFANSRANSNTDSTELYYDLRSNAIEALAFQKDPRAVPALRRILNENSQLYENNQIVKAIYECGGFSINEQVAAVESVAKSVESAAVEANALITAPVANVLIPWDKGRVAPSFTMHDKNAVTTTDIPGMLGLLLVTRADVGDDLVRAIIDRIWAVDRSDPSLASALRKVVMQWQGTAVNSMLLRDLKNNKFDRDAIIRLLSVRKELREKQQADVSDLRTGGATAIGISSCLLEDPNDYQAILESTSDETKTAMLACARLIRAPLSVMKVAENLQRKDKLLALAAERYLETEDSPEARRIVLSLHPGEARTLGATTAFYPNSGERDASSPFLLPLFATVSAYHAQPSSYFGEYEESNAAEIEKRLQNEIKRNPELLGVYSWEQNSIRIYKNEAVLSWGDDPARYRERVLTKEEFDNIKSLLAHYKADEMPPFLSCLSGEGCQTKELLMLGRNGGRRVFVKATSMPTLFAELDQMLADLRRPPSAIKYWAGKDVPGLELLFASDRVDAMAVWRSGPDFRLLTADKVRRAEIDAELQKFAETLSSDEEETEDESEVNERASKEKLKREYENFSWNNFAEGTIGSVTTHPADVEFIPQRDNFAIPPSSERWKARAGGIEIRADEKGLYKIVAGKLAKLKTGYYNKPVITPNGRWVVATMYDDDLGAQLVRINLITNKQFVVQPQEYPVYRAVAFISSINRLLVGPIENETRHDEDDESEQTNEDGRGYSLLDPETGSLMPARGEVRPLLQQTFRALQPTANQSEFWAAIPKESETVIGLYNTRNFNIKPLLKLPEISFDSMNIWVDESVGKVYFVYEGHLLAAPLTSRR